MSHSIDKEIENLRAIALLMQDESARVLKLCDKIKREQEGVSTPSLPKGADNNVVTMILAKRRQKIFKNPA